MLFDGTAYFHMGADAQGTEQGDGVWETVDGLFGEKIGEYEAPDYDGFQEHDDYNDWLQNNETSLTNEYGDEFRWTFKKNAEGDYVFAGIESVLE